MVEPVIEERRECLSESNDCGRGANYSAKDDVVPVMNYARALNQ